MCARTDLWEPWAGNRPGPPGQKRWGQKRGQKRWQPPNLGYMGTLVAMNLLVLPRFGGCHLFFPPTCPDMGLHGHGEAFARGTVGAFVGYQFNMHKPVNTLSDLSHFFDGWELQHSIAVGVWGASFEVGGGYYGALTLGCRVISGRDVYQPPRHWGSIHVITKFGTLPVQRHSD